MKLTLQHLHEEKRKHEAKRHARLFTSRHHVIHKQPIKRQIQVTHEWFSSHPTVNKHADDTHLGSSGNGSAPNLWNWPLTKTPFFPRHFRKYRSLSLDIWRCFLDTYDDIPILTSTWPCELFLPITVFSFCRKYSKSAPVNLAIMILFRPFTSSDPLTPLLVDTFVIRKASALKTTDAIFLKRRATPRCVWPCRPEWL